MNTEQAVVTFADPVQQAGFTQVPNAVLLNTNLSLPARMLYGVLQSLAWQHRRTFPDQKRLGEILGVGDRSVRIYLKELQVAGLLTMRRQGLGKTNAYTILPPRMPKTRAVRQSAADQFGSEMPENTEDVEANINLVVPAESGTREREYPADPVWDAVTAVCGPVTGEPTRAKRNKAVKAIRENLNFIGITAPEQIEVEVRRHARRYHEQFPQATLTDMALMNQWDSTAGFRPAMTEAKATEPEPDYLPLEENAKRLAEMLQHAAGKAVE